MANKTISELPQAQNVNNQDLFVLEQSGIAKKLTAETFITEQGIIDALAEALDGHGGISSVTLSSVSGRIRTYLITFTDGSATTFQVLDGTTISRIAKTSTSGRVDTYTIYMSDGTTSFFQVTNGQDGSATWDQINSKAPVITETAEGAIISFLDGADDIPVADLVVNIEPKQSGSGDPSPSNIRPITGWTGCNVTRAGANLFDKSTASSDTTWTTSGTQGFSSGNTSSALIPVNPSESYYVGFNGKANVYGVYEFDINKNYLGRTFAGALTPRAITLPNNCYYVGLVINSTYVDTAFFSYPSTATTYEPYQVSSISVDWTSEADTVYGGTIDVATGLLTVDRAMVDLGDLEWEYQSSNSRFRTTDISSLIVRPANNNTTLDCICSSYKATTYNGTSATANNNSFGIDTSGKLAIRDERYTDSDLFTAAVDNVLFVYPLATPITYNLTPTEVKTLLGANNIWADTGNTTAEYRADTKLYIEKLTMPTEDDLVANQAITSGKYFMIGNSLYLALANIASGAQITIGTNAQRVSLADALNTINS